MRARETLGTLALAMAASSASLVILRVTETFGRGSIFCSSTSCFIESLLWSLPSYAAMLAVVVCAALMAVTLMFVRVGPSGVRILTLVLAVAAAVGYVVAMVVTLDFSWAGAFSGELGPRPTAHFSPLVNLAPGLWTLSLIFTGASIALISLLMLPFRAPPPLVWFGWITGVILAAYVPLLTLWREYLPSGYGLTAQLLTAGLLALTIWALVLGIVLRTSLLAASRYGSVTAGPGTGSANVGGSA